MGVVSYIYHHDSCPRQADNIKVFVLRAGGKCFLTLWVCGFFFPIAHSSSFVHSVPPLSHNAQWVMQEKHVNFLYLLR